MCGIYGIMDFHGGLVTPQLLRAMERVTIHRGPDDEGVYIDGSCGIGMRRLSIIDLEGGHQPLSNVEGTVWLVCNGEIYNFRELRRELQAHGHRFKSGSDSEVIIHLYAEHGDEFVHRLNGMFSFALWDAPRRRLLLGRDRLGIKPLYVTKNEKRIAFASEAKALLALPDVQATLDNVALRSYLNLGYVAAPQSIFEGIEKVPPASLMVVQDLAVKTRRYWRINPETDKVTTEKEWIERVRSQIHESVRRQMISDVPIGAFLSGGLDSSSVVACMAAETEHSVKTYAIGFEGDSADDYYNELPYARQIAQRFGTQHHEIIVRPDVAALLPRLLWHMDEPVSDTAFLTTFLVAEFAKRDVTVILSGVGGDELFGGYRRYLGNHYHAYLERVPHWLRGGITAVGRALPSDRHSPFLNWSRLARGFLTSANLPFDQRYRTYVEVFPLEEIPGLMNGEATDTTDVILQSFRTAGGTDSLNRMLAVDAETQLADDLLLLTDKMTMATSLECRVPLLDHELVELAASMPENIKVRGGRLKHVMKEAAADTLPRDIIDRKKRGFGTPMGAWLKRELAPLLRHVLSENVIKRRGLFRSEPIRELIDRHNANRIDGTDRLLALLNLEIWSRIYLDDRTPQDVSAELKEAAA